MDQREDGGVGADTERQRQDGDERESGLLPEMPKRQPHILSKIAHEASGALRRDTPTEALEGNRLSLPPRPRRPELTLI